MDVPKCLPFLSSQGVSFLGNLVESLGPKCKGEVLFKGKSQKSVISVGIYNVSHFSKFA